jgi:hypothetical protein
MLAFDLGKNLLLEMSLRASSDKLINLIMGQSLWTLQEFTVELYQ